MLWLFTRTRFGRSWRAYADDPHTAALLGVDGRRLLSTTFCGRRVCRPRRSGGRHLLRQCGLRHGHHAGHQGADAALLGGIGSVPGAFLGGLAVGLDPGRLVGLFDVTLRDMVIYTFLVVLFLLVRAACSASPIRSRRWAAPGFEARCSSGAPFGLTTWPRDPRSHLFRLERGRSSQARVGKLGACLLWNLT